MGDELERTHRGLAGENNKSLQGKILPVPYNDSTKIGEF